MLIKKYNIEARRLANRIGSMGAKSKYEHVTILPHQWRVQQYWKRKMSSLKGMMLYHEMGSGKTLTAIMCALDTLKIMKFTGIIVITTSGLLANYAAEFRKFFPNKEKILRDQHEFIAIDGDTPAKMPNFAGKFVIIDESHKFAWELIVKNNAICRQIYEGIRQNKRNCRVFLLTGTPIYDLIFELSPQLNLICFDEHMPREANEFYGYYVSEIVQGPNYENYLKSVMYQKISYFWGLSYSRTTPQPKYLKPESVRINDVRAVSDALYCNTRRPFVREPSEILQASPKLHRVVSKFIKNPPGGVVLFYTHLPNILDQLEILLKYSGFSTFSPQMAGKKRSFYRITGAIKDKEIVEKYNNVAANIDGNYIKFFIGGDSMTHGYSFYNVSDIVCVSLPLSVSTFQQLVYRAKRIGANKFRGNKSYRVHRIIGRQALFKGETIEDKMLKKMNLMTKTDDNFLELLRYMAIDKAAAR